MKSSISILAVLMLLTVTFSCTKEENQNPSIVGNWKVSSLIINGNEMAPELSAYTITFDENGMMSVHDSMNTYQCNWSDKGMMNGGMMGSGMAEMHEYNFDMMGCPDDSPMQMLNEDWIISQSNATQMCFEDGASGSKSLCLTRI